MNLFSRIRNFFSNHWLGSSIIAFLIVWMIGVRFYNYANLESGYARISGILESVEELRSGATADYLLAASDFASMSALVYLDESNGGAINSRLAEDGIDLSDSLEGWTEIELPASLPMKPDDFDNDQAWLDGELVYSIWIRELDDKKAEVALVFRGTHTWGDWWSNLRWFTRFLSFGWDQYDLTRTVARHVEKNVKTLHPALSGKESVEIIAAGHSLGGGLAQQAGYAAESIKRVYSFNGSSVTGHYSVIGDVEKSKEGMRIYRVGERGEVLAYLRAFMRLIYPVVERNPKIVEVTYNFGSGNLIKQHSMAELAKALQDFSAQ